VGDRVTEHELALRVIDTLLREDYGGLSRHVTGHQLHLPGTAHPPGTAPLPGTARTLGLIRDGFLSDLRASRDGPPVTLDEALALLAGIASPLDEPGVAAFAAECRRTLAEISLRRRHPARLPARPWLGARGQLGYDALAAALPHPVYPASPCRLGLTDDDLLRYAPEFSPEFELNWAAVPADGAVTTGDRPAWWPKPSDVGLAAAGAERSELFPVHPLTRGDQPAALAPRTYLKVRPTLSVRTVAVSADPVRHIKLPLPVSTLGLRNRRLLAPGTLPDGALVRRLLAAARSGDEALAPLLLADDTRYGHAHHGYLGYLLRELPPGLDACHVVPLAALAATAPGTEGQGGRLVIEELAGPSLPDFLAAYFAVLFGVHVRLFARYGIALEAHQQNAALVTGDGQPPRLLVKDFDGSLINHARLAAALGDAAPPPRAFADRRLLTTRDEALADVFVTIIVHLCAGAVAFFLSERGVLPLRTTLTLAREALTRALDRDAAWPETALLRARVLEADRLPGKSMVTAGTLVDKARTGAADINKYYGITGPNYLREHA
jgi:siderophore synthetase component